MPTDFPPYGFVGPDLQPRGLDIDMANLIGEKLGARVTLVPVTTTNRIPYLQTGRVDLVISTLGRNPERAAVIDFTAAYSPFFIGVFGPASISVRGPEDLAGRTIAVTRGSMDDTSLTEVAPTTATIRRFEDNSATVTAFVSRQTDLLATGVSVAATVMQRNPALGAEYKFLLRESPNFIGLPKGETALRDRVNEIIAEAKANGTIDRLAQRWLGRPAGELPL
ncbi:transporter substrate-binding domain-containing protein [Elioraea sp.]|uniref:transporter substrate-binding domain-containing protein n=1 Tax=Elioraea sp. TaxID=2185103 RepID=UPI0025C66B1E|nr:transporter substrate-binding domain-containing protein [Elioraea sp.]